MSRDITVIRFRRPEAIDHPLSERAREGKRRMLAQLLIADPIRLYGCPRRSASSLINPGRQQIG